MKNRTLFKNPYLDFGIGLVVVVALVFGISEYAKKRWQIETVGGGVQEVNSDETTTETQIVETVSSLSFSNFYYAQKIGQTSTVYKFDTQLGYSTEILHFDEVKSYNRTGNLYEEFYPSVDYSPIRDELVYISNEGLFLYSFNEGQVRRIVSKTDSEDEIDEIPVPTWSNPGLSGVLNLINPRFSKDGEYLLFTGGFYEGIKNYVIDLDSGIIQTFETPDESIGRYDVDWSLEGSDLTVAADQGGYTYPGLFYAESGKFNSAKDILDVGLYLGKGPELDLTGKARFSSEDRIIYSYTVDYGKSGSEKTYFLASVKTDGNDQIIYIESNELISVEAVEEERIIYSKRENNKKTFWLFNIQTKENSPLFSENETLSNVEDFSDSTVVIRQLSEATGQIGLKFYSLAEKKFYSSPEIMTESGNLSFLGQLNNSTNPKRKSISEVNQEELSADERCETVFNSDQPNSTKSYSNQEAGISFQVPYNENWGSDKYYTDPYDTYERGLSFGPTSQFEACSWVRTVYLRIVPNRSIDQILSDFESLTNDSNYPMPIIKEINGLSIVEYHEFGLCDNAQIEIIGKGLNYIFGQVCGDSFEDLLEVVKTVQISTVETVFDHCGKIDVYQNQNWFSRFKEQLEVKGLEAENISEGCYSEVLGLFVYALPGEYCSFGSVGKYDIIFNQIYEAEYPSQDKSKCYTSAQTFGTRDGSIIKLQGENGDAGCGNTTYFDYDFSADTLKKTQTDSYCFDLEGNKVDQKTVMF